MYKMRKIIALGGVPATGKSTIVKKFLSQRTWIPRETVQLVPALWNEAHDLWVLGKYELGEKFPGTDRYSMAVQPKAIEFVQKETGNILFEGDRLFTASFLEFCAEQTGEDDELHILIITTKPTIIEARHVDRADTQSEVFKRGRETKIDNIRSNFMLMDHVVNFEHNTPQDTDTIVQYLNEQLLTRI